MASLSRWNDVNGRSAGWWLVREVPGLCIYKTHPHLGWCLQSLAEKEVSPVFNLTSEAARVWGAGADLTEANRLLGGVSRTSGFKTREEALQYVEKAIHSPADSILLEVL